MKKSLFACLMISVLMFSVTLAQGNRLAVNVVSFKNLADDTGNYTELYYSIPYSKLKFEESENTMAAIFDIAFKVRDSIGYVVIDNEMTQGIQKAISETKQRNRLKINEILKFYIKPGLYTFEFEMSGPGLESDLYYSGEFNVPKYSDTELELSQIEICSNISTDTNVEKYVKNNLMVYPNPSKVFERNKAVVFFYAELYNLKYIDEEKEQNYTLSYVIINGQGDTVKTYPDKVNKKAGSTSVIANTINLRKYDAGTYTLVLKAKDEDTQQTAVQRTTFTLENIPYITDEYAKKFREMVSYIATEQEMEIFDDLNLIGKQTFIEQFWKRRDPTPDTPENEFKMVYYQRWEFVKTRYANESPGMQGWQTDRGRIYLKYGAPTDVDRVVGNIRYRDHEIWYYESDRYAAKMFVFADTRMRGRYFLIHSESPDQKEVYNPNWRNSISTR